MIVRLVTAIISERYLAAYLQHLHKSVLPEYESAHGLVSVSISQRRAVGAAEVLTVSVWGSEESMNRFFAREQTTATAEDDHPAIHLEPRSYELVISHASPAAL